MFKPKSITNPSTLKPGPILRLMPVPKPRHSPWTSVKHKPMQKPSIVNTWPMQKPYILKPRLMLMPVHMLAESRAFAPPLDQAQVQSSTFGSCHSQTLYPSYGSIFSLTTSFLLKSTGRYQVLGGLMSNLVFFDKDALFLRIYKQFKVMFIHI